MWMMSRIRTIGCRITQKSISKLVQHSYLATTKISPPTYDASHTDRVRVSFVDNDRTIVKVELTRPSKLNSLDMAMFEAIAVTASNLQKDRSIRAVILCGEGRAFCTGLDVKSIVTSNWPPNNVSRLLQRPSGYEKSNREVIESSDGNSNEVEAANVVVAVGNLAQDVAYLWRRLPVPVIAVLHGMCFGGGMQIALGADMRFSTKDCRLSIMEAKWGLIPDMSGSITLRELVRIDVAKELTMTGRVISGIEAAELGLVTRCVEDPLEEAIRVAKQICQCSPDSVAATKRLFQDTWVSPEQTCLNLESQLQKQLLATWNQGAASARNFGWNIPYLRRQKGWESTRNLTEEPNNT